MRGVLNVNKPVGITSYDVIRHLKPLLARAQSPIANRQSPIPLGHAGTLDPMASGVLLILLGDATKASRFLLAQSKEYEAEILLGTRTDTDDVTGRAVAEAPVPDLNAADVNAILARFTGPIQQTPPAFSALKRDGEPVYRRARAGEKVELEPRTVTVYELELRGLSLPQLRVRAVVSAGTYIRALARDIGAALGTEATLARLERTRVGRFTVADALTLQALDAPAIEAGLVPVEQALDLPLVTVSDDDALRLLHGQATMNVERKNDERRADGLCLARTGDGHFLAVVRGHHELRTERVIHAR